MLRRSKHSAIEVVAPEEEEEEEEVCNQCAYVTVALPK